MKYRYLGNSGMKITELAYGNWQTHGHQIDDATAIKCVHTALDAGITTFDTADVYANGAAETVLGKALKNQRRESLEILTKVYWPVGPKGANDCGLSRKHIIESIHNSLRRLQTDYVDLYQAHRFDVETPLEETMTAFADLVRQGKVLYIGTSEWRADQIRAASKLAKELNVPLVSNQPQYSMLWRVIEAEVIPASQEVGISQIVWSPMAQGILSGKYLPGKPLPNGSRASWQEHSKGMDSFLTETVLASVQDLKPIANALNLTMPQLALAWVLQNNNISAALIGASSPEQITENIKASHTVIPLELMQKIDQILDPVIERDPTKTNVPDTRPC